MSEPEKPPISPSAHHLTINADPQDPNGIAQGFDVEVLIDGQKFPCHEITLHAGAGSALVTATISFAVNKLEVDGRVALTLEDSPSGTQS